MGSTGEFALSDGRVQTLRSINLGMTNVNGFFGLGGYFVDSNGDGIIDTDDTVYQEDAITVTPRLGLSYSKVDVDSFNERGTGANDVGSIDSFDRDWLIASLELLLGWQASEQLDLQAVLGWHYDFNNDKTILSGVNSVASPGQVPIPDVGENVFKGALSADYAINDNWSLGAGVSYLSGDDLSAFSIGASLGYDF